MRTSTSGIFSGSSIPGCRPENRRCAATFCRDQLAPILERNNFDGSVVVQANTIIEETHWLLDLAAQHEFIRGVVGWVDLTDARLGATLDELQRHPKFKGARHLVHDEPDVNWLLRADVLRGLSELARRDLPYDLLLRPPHLKLVPRIAEHVPKLRMVIDHIAKPPIAAQRLDGWAEDIAAAAQIPQVYCKLSGMITEADPRGWKARAHEALRGARARTLRAGPSHVRQRLARVHVGRHLEGSVGGVHAGCRPADD